MTTSLSYFAQNPPSGHMAENKRVSSPFVPISFSGDYERAPFLLLTNAVSEARKRHFFALETASPRTKEGIFDASKRHLARSKIIFGRSKTVFGGSKTPSSSSEARFSLADAPFSSLLFPAEILFHSVSKYLFFVTFLYNSCASMKKRGRCIFHKWKAGGSFSAASRVPGSIY